MTNDANAGQSSPLGAAMRREGVNFSVYSRSATVVELLLFDREDDAQPSRVISLDAVENRTYHTWHTFVPGVKAAQIYGYRVAGPFDPANGMLFDATKVLPMILMGDEVRRTQYGNNNAYCQNNVVNWFNWDLVDKHADVLRFTKLLIERRLLRDMEHGQRMSLNQLIRQAKFSWHGVKLNQPDWSDDSHCVSFTAEIQNDELLFHMILNAHCEPLDFELPPLRNKNDNL